MDYSYLLDVSASIAIFIIISVKYLGKGFHQVWYQGIVKATVFGVFEDLKFKISESSDQN